MQFFLAWTVNILNVKWQKILSVGNFAGKILMTTVFQPLKGHQSKPGKDQE